MVLLRCWFSPVDLLIATGPPSGPEEWFLHSDLGVVMKEKEEDTIPCLVSDPQLNVTLYARPDIPVTGLMYEPARGFTGPLKDTSYLCVASDGRQQINSQVYYVFTLVGEESQLFNAHPRSGWASQFSRLSLLSVCSS